MRVSFRGPCLALAVLALPLAASAHAAERVYWTNDSGNPMLQKIGFANLDGSAFGDVMPGAATVNFPQGTALDPAAGRVYWANTHGEISYANIDGSGGGGDLPTGTASVMNPVGLALDHAGGRVWWADYDGSRIGYANLDGSGGGNLNTGIATVNNPTGIAVDPVAGRAYWPNSSGGKISYANLDGSGGGDLDTTGATVSAPYGIAVDAVEGRVYWGNNGMPGGGISYARLGNTGGGNLAISGVIMSGAVGIALDPVTRRIFWGNAAELSSANFDGTAASNVDTGTATATQPTFPSLLARPSGNGAPSVSGAADTGATLTCSDGVWATDLVGAHLYRAPRSFAFQWTRAGEDIPGATSNTFVPTSPGAYSCRVTASNEAGAASQASTPRTVVYAFGARTRVTLRLAGGRIPASGPLRVRVANGNVFTVRGRLGGRTINRVEAARKRRIALRGKAFRLPARRAKTIRLTLPAALQRALRRDGKLRLRLNARLRDPAGHTRTVRKRVTPRLKRG